METLRSFGHFIAGSIAVVSRGDRLYHFWLLFLVVVIGLGVVAYGNQMANGLITSHMRDQVSWGYYIGNFAFLVGVAAAAIILVIPAYVYGWGPIKEVVLLGELVAISAIIMCILFVTIDVGQPLLMWHLMPGIGTPNFPTSLLVWDILVLNAYFAINYFIVTYLLFMTYTGRSYNAGFIMPLIFLSIPLAISIHTVTAFLFMSLKARPFWHTAILAPRFLAGAFCSGPALLVLVFQTVRRVGRAQVSNAALEKIGEFMAYAMGINLFFIGCEAFAEFYARSAHTVHADIQWWGGHGRTDVSIYTWVALACDSIAFILLVIPAFRHRLFLLTVACLLAVSGIFIEKGLGLMLPGMSPDVLGEVYAYVPSLNEVLVGGGVWGVGLLMFTLMAKVALAINSGEFRAPEGPATMADVGGMGIPIHERGREETGIRP